MVAFEHITEDGFEPFGTVLEFPKNCEEDFHCLEKRVSVYLGTDL